ncbi:hypothetical protein Hanom_Chr15g01388881 [Helianthus anomalus]
MNSRWLNHAGEEKETTPQEDVTVGSKRVRKGTRIEIQETPFDNFLQAPRGHGDVPYRPTWRDGPLYKQDATYQTELFYEKMVLEFRGNESGKVYLLSVTEWLSTLTKNDGNDLPRTVTLTEKVNGKPTTMSFASLSQIAKFDSKADNFYTYTKEYDYFNDPKKIVAENVMFSELFLLEKGVAMKRDNLKPLVRVLLSLVVSNVAPRLGDMMGIRKWVLVVLCALMTGVFLLKEGLVPNSEKAFEKPHATWSITEMCNGDRITHVKTKLWHKIKFGDGAKLKVLQWGKQPPSRGEMDDLDSSDEEVLRLRREVGLQVREGVSGQHEGPRQSDYSWGVFDDDMQARVHISQPPEYAGWETWQQETT